MLGKLTKELRMLGYDTIYYRGEDVHKLIHRIYHPRKVDIPAREGTS